MNLIVADNKNNVPAGYRNLTEEEITRDYLKFDIDENCIVSKNEWILSLVSILAKDIKSREKEGPDAIMRKIKDFSDEFDKYDTDGNKYLEYKEYREILLNNIFICD